MPGNVFRHLKHGNLFLASKNSFEGIVSIDQRLFLCVLKFVLLDVIPDLFGHFATRKRLRPYHLGQRIVGLNGFHESWVWFASAFSCWQKMLWVELTRKSRAVWINVALSGRRAEKYRASGGKDD